MDIRVERTPNPAAMKFTVGADVGGPATYASPEGAPSFVADVLAIDGVRSVFATADFITVSGDGGTDWDVVVPQVTEILGDAFA